MFSRLGANGTVVDGVTESSVPVAAPAGGGRFVAATSSDPVTLTTNAAAAITTTNASAARARRCRTARDNGRRRRGAGGCTTLQRIRQAAPSCPHRGLILRKKHLGWDRRCPPSGGFE